MSGMAYRVAIIQNFLTHETGGKPMVERISKLILQSQPDAEINIYAPIENNALPDIDAVDFIILTGGPFNLLQVDRPAWVNETLAFIKLATSGRSMPKILGICWGQQAIALAMGGSLAKSERGHCIGIENIPLNPEGELFFSTKTLAIHKNHEIVVADIGPRLCCLAPNNEILLSTDNQVLTFQGHPEMDKDLSQMFVAIEGLPSSSQYRMETGLMPLDGHHDGEFIFEAVMKWASEDI
ncbi:hypothetical protein ACHAPU_006314 [Fusarium lateritium]